MGKHYLLKRCILTGVVVFYVSYISLTKAAINTFYCVDVEDGTTLEDIDASHLYWALDTSVKCFEGSHKFLKIFVAIPVMMLAVILPVALAWTLIRARHYNRLNSLWVQETVGLFYRGFDEKYIFWDSVILLRKALLAAIVVFAYPLGGDLQGLLAGCLLVVSLFIHTTLVPFKSSFKHLNELESVSLLIGSLTFFGGVFLNDPNMNSEAMEVTLSVLILFSNIVFAVTLVIFIVQVKIKHVKYNLLAEGIEFQSSSTFAVLEALLVSTAATFVDIVMKWWNRQLREAEVEGDARSSSDTDLELRTVH